MLRLSDVSSTTALLQLQFLRMVTCLSRHLQSPELQEFYDWQRTKTMDCMAEVKVLVDSYK